MANPGGADDTPSTKPSITHVVFDMDGLLLNTQKFYTEVQEIILSRYNKTFDWSLKAKMMGKKATEAARVFVELTGISHSLSAHWKETQFERKMLLYVGYSEHLLPPTSYKIFRCN